MQEGSKVHSCQNTFFCLCHIFFRNLPVIQWRMKWQWLFPFICQTKGAPKSEISRIVNNDSPAIMGISIKKSIFIHAMIQSNSVIRSLVISIKRCVHQSNSISMIHVEHSYQNQINKIQWNVGTPPPLPFALRLCIWICMQISTGYLKANFPFRADAIEWN